METTMVQKAVIGAAVGVAASLIQAGIGKTEELLLLPDHEDSNIAPRLVDRLAKRAGWDPSLESEWALGTAFHFGYGAWWGVAYSAVRERYPVDPLVGGGLLGGLIYGITFPGWGGAVQTGTERHPRRRTTRMTFVAASVAVSFGLATSYLYEALRENETVGSIAHRLTGATQVGDGAAADHDPD